MLFFRKEIEKVLVSLREQTLPELKLEREMEFIDFELFVVEWETRLAKYDEAIAKREEYVKMNGEKLSAEKSFEILQGIKELRDKRAKMDNYLQVRQLRFEELHSKIARTEAYIARLEAELAADAKEKEEAGIPIYIKPYIVKKDYVTKASVQAKIVISKTQPKEKPVKLKKLRNAKKIAEKAPKPPKEPKLFQESIKQKKSRKRTVSERLPFRVIQKIRLCGEAFIKYNGVVTPARTEVGVSLGTFYKYLDNPNYLQKVDPELFAEYQVVLAKKNQPKVKAEKLKKLCRGESTEACMKDFKNKEQGE